MAHEAYFALFVRRKWLRELRKMSEDEREMSAR